MVSVKGELQDPKIAAWMLDPREEPEAQQMYTMQELIQKFSSKKFSGSASSALEKSCKHAIESWTLNQSVAAKLKEEKQLWRAYKEIEMPIGN